MDCTEVSVSGNLAPAAMSETNTSVTTPVNIRLANDSDVPALAKLRYALRSSMGGAVTEQEDEFLKRCAEWMKEHLRAGGLWQCWVAQRERDVIVCLWLQL